MTQKIKFFCINLDSRKDRWEDSKKEFQKAKLDVKRFSAFNCQKFPYYGCTFSHLSIIKYAKRKQYKNIGIFEDDVEFYNPENFIKDMQKILGSMPDDWHILYFGGFPGRDTRLTKISPNVYKVSHLMCTYAMIYNSISYDEIIKNLQLKNPKDISEVSETYVGNFKTYDKWLADEYQTKHACYVSKKFLAGERLNFSNIEKKEKNNAKKYRILFWLYKIGFGFFFRIIGLIGDYLHISNKYKNN